MGESFWPTWHCPEHLTKLDVCKESLDCPSGHMFPFINGIPRFVPNSKYAAAFGIQWKKYRLTQLDSYTRTTITRSRAQRCIGETLWNQLEGKQVLECGCGAGRF